METEQSNEEMLIEIIDNGTHIVLFDGSNWFINPYDIPTVCTWIPIAVIKVTLIDSGSDFPYQLTNLNIDVSVRVMKES